LRPYALAKVARNAGKVQPGMKYGQQVVFGSARSQVEYRHISVGAQILNKYSRLILKYGLKCFFSLFPAAFLGFFLKERKSLLTAPNNTSRDKTTKVFTSSIWHKEKRRKPFFPPLPFHAAHLQEVP